MLESRIKARRRETISQSYKAKKRNDSLFLSLEREFVRTEDLCFDKGWNIPIREKGSVKR